MGRPGVLSGLVSDGEVHDFVAFYAPVSSEWTLYEDTKRSR
jgi:hypothetical protein